MGLGNRIWTAATIPVVRRFGPALSRAFETVVQCIVVIVAGCLALILVYVADHQGVPEMVTKTAAVLLGLIPMAFALMVVADQVRLTYIKPVETVYPNVEAFPEREPVTHNGVTDWNTWFSRLRLGLWTDTDYYNCLAKKVPTGPMKARDIAWLPFHGAHLFIAGETGYGKSNTERVILKELWPGIRDKAVEVIGFDAQAGVELQGAYDAGLLKEFHFGKDTGVKSPEWPDGKPYEVTFAEALERHVEIMYKRTELMRQRSIKEWVITKDDPARVILIDEAGQLFRPNIAPKITNRIIGAIDTLTYQSRKCGYVVVACTQHSNMKQIPIRHGLTLGVAHRMKTILAYEQVTGNGMDMPHLAPGVKGLAYMSGKNKRILKTQYIPVLEKIKEPVIVNSNRMPADVPNPYENESPRLPVYSSGVGIVDTVTGEVLDSDDQYELYKSQGGYR